MSLPDGDQYEQDKISQGLGSPRFVLSRLPSWSLQVRRVIVDRYKNKHVSAKENSIPIPQLTKLF